MFQRCLNALGDGSCDRDVIMRVQGDQILEARSERLRRVSRFFKRTLTESAKVDGKYMLSITGISKEVLETLLEYADTGTLTLYDHEVAEVYYAAHRLEMPFVVHKCLQVRPLVSSETLAAIDGSKTAPKSPSPTPPHTSPRGEEARPQTQTEAEAESKPEQPHIKPEPASDGHTKPEAKSPTPAPRVSTFSATQQAQPQASALVDTKVGEGQVPADMGPEGALDSQTKPEPIQPASEDAQQKAEASDPHDMGPEGAHDSQHKPEPIQLASEDAQNKAKTSDPADMGPEGVLDSQPKPEPIQRPSEDVQHKAKTSDDAEGQDSQTKPAPGLESLVTSRPKPEPKSPKSPPPLQQPPVVDVGKTAPQANQAADAGTQGDRVQAPETQSETEIPRILRIAPKRVPEPAPKPEPISAEAQDFTYKISSKPASPKSAEKKAPPAEAVRSPSRQKAAAAGAPQGVKPASPRNVPGSRTASPKTVVVQPGTSVHGPRTAVQKVVVDEVIGPATSQAQVQSSVPLLRDVQTEDHSKEPPKPLSLASPSAPVLTFLDIVLGHFKQLAPEWIRTLPPNEIIDHLSRDDLETCCEIPVFIASLVWLHADYTARSAYAKELISCVRFSRMSADELIHCFFPPLHPEVVEIPEVKELLLAGCCYLCAELRQCCHLFPQYAAKPRKYSGHHKCHLWALPEPRDTEDEVRLELDILRETYLQRRECDGHGDEQEPVSPKSRLYSIVRTLLHRQRFINLHCYEPDPEEAERAAGPRPPVLRSFGKRRYSVQRRLDWTDHPWRQVGFSERLRAPAGEPVIAVLGGADPDRPERVATGLCMARLYPKKCPFFKRFGILPRPLYHLRAVCFNRTVYVVGGLDLRQAALKVKRSSRCCFALDLATMQWRRLADMLQGRIFHCLVAHQGKLYAVGGLGDDNSALSSAECYDPATDRWRTLSGRLCCPRLASAYALLDNGRLVLAGGAMRPLRNVENAYLINDVVVMRLPQLVREAGTIEQNLPKLPSARFSASMGRLANGGLILVGGATYGPAGYRSLDEVLLLKRPGLDRAWTKLRPTPYRVHAALVVAVGQDVYAIGGCTDRQEFRGVRQEMLVMKGGDAGHHHNDDDLCWEPWGTLPGQLVGMEAVLFSAEDARPSE